MNLQETAKKLAWEYLEEIEYNPVGLSSWINKIINSGQIPTDGDMTYFEAVSQQFWKFRTALKVKNHNLLVPGLADGYPRVLIVWEKNRTKKEEVSWLRGLSWSKNKKTRQFVAAHPDTPESLLRRLIKVEDIDVVGSIVYRYIVPFGVLEAIGNKGLKLPKFVEAKLRDRLTEQITI